MARVSGAQITARGRSHTGVWCQWSSASTCCHGVSGGGCRGRCMVATLGLDSLRGSRSCALRVAGGSSSRGDVSMELGDSSHDTRGPRRRPTPCSSCLEKKNCDVIKEPVPPPTHRKCPASVLPALGWQPTATAVSCTHAGLPSLESRGGAYPTGVLRMVSRQQAM